MRLCEGMKEGNIISNTTSVFSGRYVVAMLKHKKILGLAYGCRADNVGTLLHFLRLGLVLDFRIPTHVPTATGCRPSLPGRPLRYNTDEMTQVSDLLSHCA